jgi:hypothetical protein
MRAYLRQVAMASHGISPPRISAITYAPISPVVSRPLALAGKQSDNAVTNETSPSNQAVKSHLPATRVPVSTAQWSDTHPSISPIMDANDSPAPCRAGEYGAL